MSFLTRLFKRGKKDDQPIGKPSHACPAGPGIPSADGGPPQPAPRPRRAQRQAPEPEPAAPSMYEPSVRRIDAPMDEQRAHAVLESVLDDLGTAHHRPFSRG